MKFTKEDILQRFEEAMREGEPQGKIGEQDFSQVAKRIKELAGKNRMVGKVNATSS